MLTPLDKRRVELGLILLTSSGKNIKWINLYKRPREIWYKHYEEIINRVLSDYGIDLGEINQNAFL